jgi:hypothetical protein
MKKFLGIVVLGLLLSGNAYAGGITVKVYLDAMSRNNKELTAMIERNIMAVNDGLMYANNELKHSNQERVYCQPPTLAMNTKVLIGFLDAEIEDYLKRGVDVGPVPIGMLLVKSLKRNFPCN